MSTLTEDRAAIVTALAGVAGVSASPTVPTPIVAGCAWPIWEDLIPVTKCMTTNHWEVFVALPGSSQLGTVSKGEELLYAAIEVLSPLGTVTVVEPMQWPVETGQQSIPVLRFGLEI